MPGSLVCKNCATSHSLDERFCPRCGMPLVYAPGVASGGGPITEQHERARKVKPQYGEGELVKVAWARNQAEAELIAGLLLEEGVPSVTRRTGGFDVPDFIAAGPRDILVAASGVDVAREVLADQRTPRQATTADRDHLGTSSWWVQALAILIVVILVGSTIAGLIAALR